MKMLEATVYTLLANALVVGLMAVVAWFGNRKDPVPEGELWQRFWKAMPPLFLLPVVVTLIAISVAAASDPNTPLAIACVIATVPAWFTFIGTMSHAHDRERELLKESQGDRYVIHGLVFGPLFNCTRYLLEDDGSVVECDDYEYWKNWFGQFVRKEKYVLAQAEINHGVVRTTFLGMAPKSEPYLFETIVATSEHALRVTTKTRDAALLAHAEYELKLRQGTLGPYLQKTCTDVEASQRVMQIAFAESMTKRSMKRSLHVVRSPGSPSDERTP